MFGVCWMKLIVGLGNPGSRYERTRHNIGFEVIDELASRNGVKLNESKFNGLFANIHKNGEKAILLKPLTYMNLSGKVSGRWRTITKSPQKMYLSSMMTLICRSVKSG